MHTFPIARAPPLNSLCGAAEEPARATSGVVLTEDPVSLFLASIAPEDAAQRTWLAACAAAK